MKKNKMLETLIADQAHVTGLAAKGAAVLIGCEESQVITIAMRELGIEAYSCDIQDCSGGHPEWHLKMDIFKALKLRKWSLVICHPECTKVCISGNSTYSAGKEKYDERIESAKWIQNLWDSCIAVCDKVVFENPIGVLNSLTTLPIPQIIQPYQFGEPESKKTCLFIFGLPELKPTKIVSPEYARMKNGKIFKDARGFKDSPTHYRTLMIKDINERRKQRSKTFEGIGKAIAKQWGLLAAAPLCSLPVTVRA